MMGIDPNKTDSKLKINMGSGSTRGATPETENKDDGTSRLKKKTGGSGTSGILKISGGTAKPKTPREELPEPAYYPWHALSPRKTESLDTGDIVLEPASVQGKAQKFDWISVVFQPLGALLAIVVLLIILHVTGAGMSMGLYMLIGGVTGVLGILWGVIRYHSQKKEAANAIVENEEKYRAYLCKMENEISAIAEKQRRILNADFPPVQACIKMDEKSSQLWNCDIEDSAFLSFRLGSGRLPLSCNIVSPTTRYSDENALNEEAQALAQKYALVEDVPIVCNLRDTTTLGVVGSKENTTTQVLSLIANITARHSYEDLKIAIIYPESEKDIWGEARFIPHVFDDGRDFRFLANTAKEAKALIQNITDIVTARKEAQSSFGFGSGQLFRPHYIVIFIDTSLGYMLRPEDPELGVSCVYVASSVNRLPSHCEQIVELDGKNAKFYIKSASDVVQTYSPDRITELEWKEYVHHIAAIRLETPKVKTGIPRSFGFLQMYGVSGPEQLNVDKRWKTGKPDKSLSVIIGAGDGSSAEEFDIYPDKCGPNGIFIGTAGSGKTSMVRAWILSMAVSYSPEDVNFVLIDFKDPGLLNGLEKLPHVVGTIGKLDAESGDIYRNLTALNSEMDRRQRMLKKANSVSIYDYRRKRYAGNENAREAMSFLFIVVDELNEFKSWNRDSAGADWMTALDSLYQKGRALGIQIIAGSQTTGPFTSIMDGNANFRWCLRTQMKQESRDILGTEDAYHIRNKGRAYMRVGGDITEIQPAYADGVFYTQSERAAAPEREIALISLNGERTVLKPPVEDRLTELELTTNYIAAYAKKNSIQAPRRIWPSRLPEHLLLEQLPDLDNKDQLSAVVGLLDDPVKQVQYPMQIDLPQHGSFLVFGAARTGKTSFLQSFTFSLLINNSPDYMETYIIESSVGDFSGFDAFPQVKKIVSNDNADETVKTVSDILIKRKSRPANEKDKRVVLIVDGLNSLMGDHEKKAKILSIIQNGGGRGVYLVGSAMNMIGLGSVSQISDQTKRGLSFWVDHSNHSYNDLIHDKNVKTVPPADIPGRGITSIGRVVSFQTAMLLNPEDTIHQSEYIKEKAAIRWSDYKNTETSVKKTEKSGVVVIGERIGVTEPVTHDFLKNAGLLVLCNDYDQRIKVLDNIARQLVSTISTKAFIGVDFPGKIMYEKAEMLRLSSGQELDEYLLSIKEDLSSRGSVRLAEGDIHPPYCFVIPDLAECMKRSKASVKRIDNNLILGGKSFSIFTIIGCSYSDFDTLMAKEMSQISQGSGNKTPVPVMRLARGRTLLMDANTTRLNPFFQGKFSFGENNDYYLAGEEAIPLVLYRGGETI